MTGQATFDAAAKPPTIDLALAAGRVQLPQAFSFLSPSPKIGGILQTVALKAKARGDTPAALIATLGGELRAGTARLRLSGERMGKNAEIRPSKPTVTVKPGNHRKIVVIDDRITYCGSQNCADPEFLVKAKYAPWVDAMMRFEGPIARQNQHLFAGDWMARVDDDIDDLLRRPIPSTQPGVAAQAIGTGPTVRYSAMPEMFESLIYSAPMSRGGF